MGKSFSSVVHITSWLSRRGGGIPPVVWSLARENRRMGIDCLVAGLRDEYVEADCNGYNVPFATGAIIGPSALGFSPGLASQVCARVKPGGIIHSHGLWMHPGTVARKCASQARCPLVISPHGMLEPWALNHSRWKKRLAAWLFEDTNLQAASCLHALCTQEAENLRRFGLRNPIAIISNGVDVGPVPLPAKAEQIIEKFPAMKGRKRLLFLSRIHPKKGLVNLLHAWKEVAPGFQDWRLMIAGPDEVGHEEQLKALSHSFGTDDSVCFPGPVYGEDKKALLSAVDAFILPSFSEGISMAVLEAAGAALPVMLTRQCNFPELARAGGAIEVSSEAMEIKAGLQQLLGLSDMQRKTMGQRGRELMEHGYTWDNVARQMVRVYEWLAGAVPPPEFVRLD
jgi:glycosyltransferase involved in cell wall biosynthesis